MSRFGTRLFDRSARDKTLLNSQMDIKHLNQTVNHLFRNEFGKMVSVLVRIFGSQHLQLAEDVVQESLISALETWKFKGIPDNPESWLYKVARNKAIDLIRREKHSQAFDFSDPEHQLLTSEYTLLKTMENFWTEKQIRDDFLGMMYACCHPNIAQENQIAFILKTLCGFSIKEIAKAFLSNEETISKRIYRTKEYFRTNRVQPKIPPFNELPSKTSSVLNTIYLMFNEGYNSTHTVNLIREDIIEQALFLCKALTENEHTRLPEVYALTALICFHTARSKSRISNQGELVLLTKQDRNLWDRELINLANHYLNQSAFGDKISTFHIEAAIAYEHCIAKDYASTDWKTILNHYDTLITISPSPVVFLNRCIAVMELQGAKEALNELNKISSKKSLQNYYLYYALLGELQNQLGDNEKALLNLIKAQDLTHSPKEKIHLSEKIKLIQINHSKH